MPEILNTMERKSHLKSKVPKDKFKPLREREPESTGASTRRKFIKKSERQKWKTTTRSQTANTAIFRRTRVTQINRHKRNE